MNKRILVLVVLVSVLAVSCNKDDEPDYIPPGPYANGAFISNEGTFGLNNASVSFYDFVKDSVFNGIYSSVNGRPLGRLLQSVCTANGKAYMVLNMSDTVVVARADDFKETGIITGLKLPRYISVYNNKGYVTQWGKTVL